MSTRLLTFFMLCAIMNNMKRKYFFVALVMLLGVFALILGGCSAFTGIHTAYEKAGYDEADASKYREHIEPFAGKDYEDFCKAHVFIKAVKTLGGAEDEPESEEKSTPHAIILEFPSEDEMLEYIDNVEILKEHVGETPLSEQTCGNCLLLYAAHEEEELLFKNSK